MERWKKIQLIILGGIFSFNTLLAQEFTASVSSDSILLGNYIILEFKVANLEGKFEAPDLSDFELVGGPQISTSMQIINGESSSLQSYSYHIKPLDPGPYTIEAAYITSEDKTLETNPIPLTVYPNPEGIINKPKSNSETYNFDFNFPDFQFPNEKKSKETETPKPDKPKRKLKKI